MDAFKTHEQVINEYKSFQQVTDQCKVFVVKPEGKEMPYHITPKVEKDDMTGNYKQVSPTSAMVLAMLGKGVNESFEFNNVTYTIKSIEA